MGAPRTKYNIVGRYINEDDARDVVGYHLRSLDGTKDGRYGIDQVAFLVGRGSIENCSVQLYKDKVLFRGEGISLDSLPVQKVHVDKPKKKDENIDNTTETPVIKKPVHPAQPVRPVQNTRPQETVQTPKQPVQTEQQKPKENQAGMNQLVKWASGIFIKRYNAKVTYEQYNSDLRNAQQDTIATSADKVVLEFNIEESEVELSIFLGTMGDKSRKFSIYTYEPVSLICGQTLSKIDYSLNDHSEFETSKLTDANVKTLIKKVITDIDTAINGISMTREALLEECDANSLIKKYANIFTQRYGASVYDGFNTTHENEGNYRSERVILKFNYKGFDMEVELKGGRENIDKDEYTWFTAGVHSTNNEVTRGFSLSETNKRSLGITNLNDAIDKEMGKIINEIENAGNIKHPAMEIMNYVIGEINKDCPGFSGKIPKELKTDINYRVDMLANLEMKVGESDLRIKISIQEDEDHNLDVFYMSFLDRNDPSIGVKKVVISKERQEDTSFDNIKNNVNEMVEHIFHKVTLEQMRESGQMWIEKDKFLMVADTFKNRYALEYKDVIKCSPGVTKYERIFKDKVIESKVLKIKAYTETKQKQLITIRFLAKVFDNGKEYVAGDVVIRAKDDQIGADTDDAREQLTIVCNNIDEKLGQSNGDVFFDTTMIHELYRKFIVDYHLRVTQNRGKSVEFGGPIDEEGKHRLFIYLKYSTPEFGTHDESKYSIEVKAMIVENFNSRQVRRDIGSFKYEGDQITQETVLENTLFNKLNYEIAQLLAKEKYLDDANNISENDINIGNDEQEVKSHDNDIDKGINTLEYDNTQDDRKTQDDGNTDIDDIGLDDIDLSDMDELFAFEEEEEEEIISGESEFNYILDTLTQAGLRVVKNEMVNTGTYNQHNGYAVGKLNGIKAVNFIIMVVKTTDDIPVGLHIEAKDAVTSSRIALAKVKICEVIEHEDVVAKLNAVMNKCK